MRQWLDSIVGSPRFWFAATIITIGGVSLGAQGIQRIAVNVSTPDPETFINVFAPESCSAGGTSVTDGSFVRHSVNQPLVISLDARAAITGVCQYWFNGVHFPKTTR